MKTQSRRDFIRKSVAGVGGLLISGSNIYSAIAPENNENLNSLFRKNNHTKKIIISATDSQFEREPLKHPFGFKGGYLSELWQIVSRIQSQNGNHAIGLGTQSVLWSDSDIFSNYSESGGNALMYALTVRALQMIKGTSYNTPVDVIDEILPELLQYGKKITNNSHLRQTFILNSLVSIDNALWLLYAKENKITNFDDLIPYAYKPAFTEHHDKLAAIPLISYNVTPNELKHEVENGYFFMKIKIGQQGTQQEMLKKDMNRLLEIHNVLKDARTPYTASGKLPYYFDANGRYESKDTFMRFLDYADKIKAFDQIAIIEEPFPEDMEISVKDIPVRLAADESAHTEKDAVRRIQMGYKAMALKPIAKTLSMTMKIAKVATERDIPCFCADLTVNPIMVEWNKNVAARLKSFPGLNNIGLVESNGHQNYQNWDKMNTYNPSNNESWIKVEKGFYPLENKFYEKGGGIFNEIPHYEQMFCKNQ